MGNCLARKSRFKKQQETTEISVSSKNEIKLRRQTSAPATLEDPPKTEESVQSLPPLASVIRIPPKTRNIEYLTATVLPSRSEKEVLASQNLKVFSYKEIIACTNGFSTGRIIGNGGFGIVYQGWVKKENLSPSLPRFGIPVAVKRLSLSSNQGHNEWLAEINYLEQLNHPNILKLLGFCLKRNDRILIYEFMENGSLDVHLYGEKKTRLPWEIRMRIATDVARALSYLHEPHVQVICGDIKSSNILLDKNFNAKICDLGFARSGRTIVQTTSKPKVNGTPGYIDPDYSLSGRLTMKCDVYSYGVLLMELITGQPPYDYSMPLARRKLADRIKPNFYDESFLDSIIDREIKHSYSKEQAYVLAVISSHCLQFHSSKRPTMEEILYGLEMIQGLSHQSFPKLPIRHLDQI